MTFKNLSQRLERWLSKSIYCTSTAPKFASQHPFQVAHSCYSSRPPGLTWHAAATGSGLCTSAGWYPSDSTAQLRRWEAREVWPDAEQGEVGEPRASVSYSEPFLLLKGRPYVLSNGTKGWWCTEETQSPALLLWYHFQNSSLGKGSLTGWLNVWFFQV